MIQIQDLKKQYGSFKAVKGISFSVSKGEVLGLLGPNGAGKTTTMKTMMGFLAPTSGTVHIKEKDIEKESLAIQKHIGYLPENTPLYPELNVQEHLEFTAKAHDINNVDAAIQKVAKMCGLSERLYFNISELSKGYKQRVGLAQALIHDPEIIILDEPTTGLDPNQIVEIRDLIKTIGKKKTVILSTHIMQEVEATCTRVVVMNNGEIVAQGTPEELTGANSSAHAVRIVIQGVKKTAQDVLKKIKGITHIDTEKSETKGTTVFILQTEKDMRAEIATAIVKGKLNLLEMTSKLHSMEEVFQQLTK